MLCTYKNLGEKMQMASFLVRRNPILRRIKVSIPRRPLHDDVYGFDVVHFHARMHECAGEGGGGELMRLLIT